jgi:hypothetical protein
MHQRTRLILRPDHGELQVVPHHTVVMSARARDHDRRARARDHVAVPWLSPTHHVVGAGKGLGGYRDPDALLL